MTYEQQNAAILAQIPAYLWDMVPGELQPFSGSSEQTEKVWSTCHKSYHGCRLWESTLTDEDGEQLLAVFLDAHEDGNLLYWGTFDI